MQTSQLLMMGETVCETLDT